jgi:hypothetical protein
MKRLIADISSGKVNNVLVYKIDRLTRSTKNLIELIELFNQHDCAFNSLNEAIDTSTATGRMFLKIVGIFAEFERENLAERLRLGFERKAREGHSLCTYASYGYDRKRGEKTQTVVPEEAEVVRRIFHRPVREPRNAELARQNFANQGSNDDANVERSLGVADAEWRNFDRQGGVAGFSDRSSIFQAVPPAEGKFQATKKPAISELFPEGKPILSGLTCGHCMPNITLPLGATVSISTELTHPLQICDHP